ncbi:MAG: FtsW/RodA/SpoVE family cell cycle protein, partial [Gordonibacter sp.]
MAQPPQINSVKAPDKAVVDATRSRRFPALNFPLIIVAALLLSYGLIVVYSAVSNNENYSFSRSLAGVAAGLVVMIVIWRFDYRRLSEFTTLFLIVNVVLILSPHLPLIGVEAKGAQSWINIGTQIQPGEFAKVTVILLDASVVARYGGKLDDPREYLKALGIMLIPFVCIMTQPDLGTGLVYLFIAAVALVVGGARPKFLLLTLLAGVIAIACVFAIDEVIKGSSGEYKLLKDYQRSRLLVFLDPDA